MPAYIRLYQALAFLRLMPHARQEIPDYGVVECYPSALKQVAMMLPQTTPCQSTLRVSEPEPCNVQAP